MSFTFAPAAAPYPDSDDSDDAPVAAPAAEPPKAKPTLTRIRTNHLGVPLRAESLRKIRYQQTMTVVWDSGTMATKERDDGARIWRLLMDTRAVIDGSIRGLTRLFQICRQVAPSPDHSMLTLTAFRIAMGMYSVRDDVLIMRLFEEFCERDEDVDDRIDARHFIRQFVAINHHEPLEDRVSLFFDLWDMDDSGTLKQSELADHVVHDLPVYKRDRALHALNRVWTHIRGLAMRDNEFQSSLNPTEVMKPNVIEAVKTLPVVAHFFDEFLMRRPPKANTAADWTETGRKNALRARMKKLDAEVRIEVRGQGQRPATANTTVVGAGGAPVKGVPQGVIDPRLLDVGLIQVRHGGRKAGDTSLVPREKRAAYQRSAASDRLGSSVEAANQAALSVLKPQRAATFSTLPPSPSASGEQQPKPRPVRPSTSSSVGRGFGSAAQHRYHSFVAGSDTMSSHAPPRSASVQIQQNKTSSHKLTSSRTEANLMPSRARPGTSGGVRFSLDK